MWNVSLIENICVVKVWELRYREFTDESKQKIDNGLKQCYFWK